MIKKRLSLLQNAPCNDDMFVLCHHGMIHSAQLEGKMAVWLSVNIPMKKSCQDLEKNLGKIFSRSCKNLARNQAKQDFRMDLEQESCKIRKILASSKSWHGFGTDFLPTCQILKRLGKILQDIFDRVPTGVQ